MGRKMSTDAQELEKQEEIEELRALGYSPEEIRALLSEDLWAGGIVS